MDNRAIRTKKWSLVKVDCPGWELCDVRKNPLETNGLANIFPKKVNELAENWLQRWTTESGESAYNPESTFDSPHYKPQGDKGTGDQHVPSAMPQNLKGRYQKKP